MVLSASAGAFIFAALLFVTLLGNVKLRDIAFAVVLGSIVFMLFSEQISAKLSIESSLSLLHRLENFKLAWSYINDHFPYPQGFGPMIVGGREVGITSFLLLVVKSFGIFALFAIAFLWKLRGNPVAIAPILVISSVVGNFWETPIFLTLFFFAWRRSEKLGRLYRQTPDTNLT